MAPVRIQHLLLVAFDGIVKLRILAQSRHQYCSNGANLQADLYRLLSVIDKLRVFRLEMYQFAGLIAHRQVRQKQRADNYFNDIVLDLSAAL